ncbi:MAG: acyl carrier protein [Spirochaetota bacterium]
MNQPETVTQSLVADRVRAFITDTFLFGEEDDRFTDEASFLETGIIDSTGLLELIAFVEEEFSFRIAEQELTPSNLDSVANISSFVLRNTGAAPE